MNKQGIVIHPEELTEKMLNILGKTDINVLGIHPVGGENAAETLEDLLRLMKNAEFNEKLNRVRKFGISVEYELHALSWLLPRSMFEKNPDWFRMNDNRERVCDFHMCVSNEKALEYLSSRSEKLAEILKSDTGKYYFWVDDVEDAFCKCEKCKKLSPSDQALIIYNAILRGIRRVDKNAAQCYLAYQKTMEPPVKIKPENGIFLEYAPMWRNTKIPLNNEECGENVKFLKFIQPLLDYFGKKDAQVLEYWLDNSLFSRWRKPPKVINICEDTIKNDIKFYKQCGFEGITTFACYLSDDYMELYGKPPIEEYSRCF